MVAYSLMTTIDFTPRRPSSVEPVMERARRDTKNANGSPISSDCPFCLKSFSTALESAGKKVAYGGCNLCSVSLQREVAGVEKANDGVGNVAFESLGAPRKKEGVVLAPRREEGRLVRAEIGLEGRIQRDVGLIVPEQIELHVVGAGASEIVVVERISVRRDMCRVGRAVRILPDRRLGLEKGAQGVSIGRRSVLPIGADRIPALAQPFFVGIAVLRNDRRDALRMLRHDAKPGWRAVVEDIDREPREPNHLGEAVDHAGQMIEGVSKVPGRRHIRAAEARQVGRDEPKAVGEHRNEIAEHVARGRKAMQQQKHGSVCGTRLTVKDLEAVDVSGLVFDDGHGTFFLETAACHGLVVELAGIFLTTRLKMTERSNRGSPLRSPEPHRE